jgi:hypothetical protein
LEFGILKVKGMFFHNDMVPRNIVTRKHFSYTPRGFEVGIKKCGEDLKCATPSLSTVALFDRN